MPAAHERGRCFPSATIQAERQQRAARKAGRKSDPDARAEEQRQREGQHAKSGGGRALAEDVLQVERQVGHHDLRGGGKAEHGDRAPRKRAVAKQAEVHHGALLRALRGDEEAIRADAGELQERRVG